MNEFAELSEEGKKEAKKLLKAFGKKLIREAEEKISDLYTYWLPHMETDAWINFKRDCLAELKNYGKSKKIHSHDWKQIRQAILQENREEIIADINQDLLEKIQELESHIAVLNDLRSFGR